MYTLVRHIQSHDALLVEAPAVAVSWTLAETFYKFHSFTLECGCFLATWLALSSLLALVMRPAGETPAE